MAEVKLKEETELWDPAEHNNSVEPPRIKEEPEEVQLQEFSFFAPVCVKTEDDEDKSSVLHQRPTEENREETNGEDCGAEAGCSSEEEHPKGADSGEDSDWSWDWEPPPKQTVTGRRAAATKEPQTGVQIVSAKREQFPFAPVCVKTEDDEDKSSVLHQRPTEENREETNGEDCGAEAGCSSDPLTQLHSDSEEHPNGEDSDAEEEEDDEERPHKCSFCGKCFKNTSHFNQHLKIHSGEKPYSCSICKKAFLRSRTLTEHIRTHTGEKPFSCSVCKNDFTSKARMKKHMKIHTGEKPFSCPFCDKCFVQRSFLVIHIRQHTGEKPFSCTLCHRSYTDKSSLRKHMKKHRTVPVPQEPHSPLQNGLPESYDRERGSDFGHSMPSV